MDAAKHTPGPWRANPSLEAAAPDLLEAVKGLLKAYHYNEGSIACRRDLIRAAEIDAKAAIAKAEGRN